MLFAAGDVLAQMVTMEKGGKYDRPRMTRAAIFGAFMLGPLAHLHFNFMEWLVVRKVRVHARLSVRKVKSTCMLVREEGQSTCMLVHEKGQSTCMLVREKGQSTCMLVREKGQSTCMLVREKGQSTCMLVVDVCPFIGDI